MTIKACDPVIYNRHFKSKVVIHKDENLLVYETYVDHTPTHKAIFRSTEEFKKGLDREIRYYKRQNAQIDVYTSNLRETYGLFMGIQESNKLKPGDLVEVLENTDEFKAGEIVECVNGPYFGAYNFNSRTTYGSLKPHQFFKRGDKKK